MQQLTIFKNHKHYALQAFLINLLIGVLGLSWTIFMKGGLFSVAGDFNVQQIPFAMYANDAIKSGNVIWDWSLDLGSNFIGGMTFYVLGNPSFWLSLLFPSEAFIYVVGWIYILKYAFAGLTAYLWLKRFVKRPEYAVTASIMYAFSGFMNENLLFYHFHDVVLLFPLLLLTFDMLMEERKSGPFIFAVLINAIVNYFFFFGEVYFLIAYFILRYVMSEGIEAWKRVPQILLEAVLGVLCGMLLLWPSVCFTLQNPRVKFDYYGNNSLVFSTERYLYILKALVFPGEVMSNQSAVIEHNFASCAAYLPMAGMVLVIAFLKMQKKHWVTRMLKWCLVMAIVPILNASFSLFAGLYHRWFYMPVLLFALCGAYVLEELDRESRNFEEPTPAERAVTFGTVVWGLITIGFVMFLLFVPWSSSGDSKIFREDVFAGWTCISIGGTLVTWVILTQGGRRRQFFFRIGVGIIAVATTASLLYLYHQANGELADGLHDRIVTSAGFEDPGPMYRFQNRDNPETLTHGYQTSANFCSTVSGSIFRFYTSLGLKRDVKSPDAPNGLHQLISARYRYETSEDQDLGEPVQELKGAIKSYYIYEDETIPPIGFTYDTYMTASEFAETKEEDRAILMLKTLVVQDEDELLVSDVLRHYDPLVDGEANKDTLESISAAHLEECSKDTERTTSSYASTITADSEKYAFYSIPADSGWSAEVNGEEALILDINGFMAVRVFEGDNRIVFHYEVPGLKAGILMTILGFACSLIYCIVTWKKRKQGKQSALVNV